MSEEIRESEIDEIVTLANIKIEKPEMTYDEILNNHIKHEIKLDFHKKYLNSDFDKAWSNFLKIPTFPALGNINDMYEMDLDEETHYVMRLVATWHINNALKALKFDTTNDPNLKKDDSIGNIGTAGRIAKIWAGNGLDSENIREYGAGRFTKEPRLAAFPASEKEKNKPVTVTIENAGIGSVCSHHFLPFSVTNDKNSKIVVSYIPKNKVLGLSKITRFVEWCLNRPSLQEEVTDLIHEKIKTIAETDDVYVGLLNIVHTCETTRGSKQYSTTTTENYSGAYENSDLRDSIISRVM